VPTELESFRAHCRALAVADHKPECKAKGADRWGWEHWTHPDPDCAGCDPQSDRELFARLADEVDSYLSTDDPDALFPATEKDPNRP
jgi:hypothetical protein